MKSVLSSFQAPIPGSSLTKEFGTMPHQKPPKITDIEAAKEYVWKELHKENIIHSVWFMAERKMPIVNIAYIIVYKAAMSSLFTIDVAILIVPAVAGMVSAICKWKGIDPVIAIKTKTATDKLFEDADMQKLLEEAKVSDSTKTDVPMVPTVPENVSSLPEDKPMKSKGIMSDIMAGE